jgi:hypothetical protein
MSAAATLIVAAMVTVAILFVADASRRGTARMLAATAVSIGWLALTAVALRSVNQFTAGYAARNYAVVMTVLLLVYFCVKIRRSSN